MLRILIVVGLAISFTFIGCPKTASDKAPVLDNSSQNNCTENATCNTPNSIMQHKVCVLGPYADQGCIGQCAMPQFHQTCTTNIVNAEGKDITADLNQLCNAAQSAGAAPQQYWYCQGAGPSNCPYYLAQQGFCGCCSVGLTGCFDYSNNNDPSPYCVDLKSDLNNCGVCGNVCPSGSQCLSGVCTPLCPSGETYCLSANSTTTCYATQKDANNCGGINNQCAGNDACQNGQCSACTAPNPAGKIGSIVCPNSCAPGSTSPGCQYRTCVEIDADNCGSCGATCSGSQVCAWQATSGGSPVAKCCPDFPYNNPEPSYTPKWVVVKDTCVNLTADPNNCSSVGHVCQGPKNYCLNGECVCPPGTAYCSATNSCNNLSSDVNNCGACGNRCPAYYSCNSGKCVCTGDCACASNCNVDGGLPLCTSNCTGAAAPICQSNCNVEGDLPSCTSNCNGGNLPKCTSSCEGNSANICTNNCNVDGALPQCTNNCTGSSAPECTAYCNTYSCNCGQTGCSGC